MLSSIDVWNFFFANDIYEFFAKPIQSILPIDGGMIATEIASTFLAPFKLTLFLSVILSMPYTLFQLWSFVAPGLYKKEKKIVIPIFFSSIIFFYLGMIFCYLIVFPIIFGFFSSRRRHTRCREVSWARRCV